MSRVSVRELIAWDLDIDACRPVIETLDVQAWHAQKELWKCVPYLPGSPILAAETATLQSQLDSRIPAIGESGEFDGLEWSLAVVDLRKLLAFQRRLCFEVSPLEVPVKVSSDWDDLLKFTLPEKSNQESLSIVSLSETEMEIRSCNPNFRLTLAAPNKQEPSCFWIRSSYGSPYMEVAQYRDRWFLRDGYHRAYVLLRDGVFAVPVVVVQASTLEELGAGQPCFFSEEILFSDYPPRLLDYQNKKLVLEYERAAREKVIRVSLHESYEVCQEDVLQTR